jgi:biotin carboxyl carrier protein
MKYLLSIQGQTHTLEVKRGDPFVCSLDGDSFSAEVAEVQPGMYSVLIEGKSFAVRVEASAAGGLSNNGGEYAVQVDSVSCRIAIDDLRRRRRGGSHLSIEGRQVVKAPMPGKVIRVLVSEGAAVEAGQGLVVVEAMKMQNEVKSPKAGSVRKVMAQVGQAVNAGETLAVVE